MSAHASVGPNLVVRHFRDLDESEVLGLLRGSLGGGPAGERTPEYFRWKHIENPFGRSYMIVAESDQRIIGFRALMRWRFRVGDRTIEAVRPVDTVTHPEYRGRGIFSMLTRKALDSLKGEVELVFNTPNSDSLPGYLKMGWQVVGQLPVSVRICRPARFIAGKLGRGRVSGEMPSNRPGIAAPTAAEVLARERGIVRLIDQSEVASGAYSTPVNVDYLRWRYGNAPLLGYHAIQEDQDGELSGVAFFRARREGSVWGLVISHLLVRPGDVVSARRLLTHVRRSADVGYVATLAPPGSMAAKARRGTASIRAPRRPTLVVNPLQQDLRPDPRLISSWALFTGDVEVF